MINQLTIHNLTHQCQQKIFFSAINLQLMPGELLLVTGENGSGKTTLLRLLTGLMSASQGTICWNGENIIRHLCYPLHLHYVGHQNGLKLGLTTIENLQLMAHLMQCPSLQLQLTALLSTLQLTAQQNQLTQTLSAGQKRRLALAKLFILEKPLWILDEPLTSLDEITQQFFIEQLKNHLTSGGLAVISSHQQKNYEGMATKTIQLQSC